MTRYARFAIFSLVLLGLPEILPANTRCSGNKCSGCTRQGFSPVGGWRPYGGSICHWWNPCWSDYYATSDDYCRKPLPRHQSAPIPRCACPR